jgi:hypothetical protein
VKEEGDTTEGIVRNAAVKERWNADLPTRLICVATPKWIALFVTVEVHETEKTALLAAVRRA